MADLNRISAQELGAVFGSLVRTLESARLVRLGSLGVASDACIYRKGNS